MLEEYDREVRRVMGWEGADPDCCSPEAGQSEAAAVAGTVHAAFEGGVGSHSYVVADDEPSLKVREEVREEVGEGMGVAAHLGRGGRYVGL